MQFAYQRLLIHVKKNMAQVSSSINEDNTILNDLSCHSKNAVYKSNASQYLCASGLPCMWMETSMKDILFKFSFFNKNANGNVKMHIN